MVAKLKSVTLHSIFHLKCYILCNCAILDPDATLRS